jgi:hypothetical protein
MRRKSPRTFATQHSLHRRQLSVNTMKLREPPGVVNSSEIRIQRLEQGVVDHLAMIEDQAEQITLLRASLAEALSLYQADRVDLTQSHV